MFCPLFTAWERCFPIPCSLCLSLCLTPAPSTYHSGWGPFLKPLRKGLPRGRADEDGQCSSNTGHAGEGECLLQLHLCPQSCRESEVGWTAARKQGCGTCAPEGLLWTPPLVHLVLPRGSRARQPAAPGLDPPHGLPNQFLEKHRVCFPAFTNCPLIAGWRRGWSLNGILSMGLRGIWFLSYPSHKVPEGNTWKNSSWNLSCWGDPCL